MSTFVAIDFETADKGADSACSVGLVRVENGVVSRKAVQMIRPPRMTEGDLFNPNPDFEFTRVHGIKPEMVADKPTFGTAGSQFPGAHSLYGAYEHAQAGFAERYLAMLSAGGTKHYSELLKPFGLDARDPQFWDGGLSVISGMIDELEALG